jgi:shikimate dehydrogenase
LRDIDAISFWDRRAICTAIRCHGKRDTACAPCHLDESSTERVDGSVARAVDLRRAPGNVAAMSILSGHARVAGIAGWPVTYSRSPRLHGFWLQRYAIDGTYVPLPIQAEAFATAMRGLMAAGFAGANVTIPHKLAAFDICDTVDDTARRAGAVNTLVFRDGRIAGSNTDGYGFIANLRAHGVDPAVGPALLLGAGGSARAVAAALQDAGAQVTLANRTRARAEALARDLPGLHVIDWDARAAALADHALVVNTTPLGMVGHGSLELDFTRAPPTLAVADNVYVPLETPLLAEARTRGLHTVGGLGMLLHQAVPGFHAWFGVKPEVDDELLRFVAADLPMR